MKILLTGKNGQLGWELVRTLAALGRVVSFDRASLDLSSSDQILSRMREVKPDLIVNAAAYTAVDRAEGEPELATRVNATAPGILAEEARRLDATLIHYSTDYVFDGTKATPYLETDPPNPVNVYGRTKLEGELAIRATGCRHMILRTSWIYGTRGQNFLLTMIRLSRERAELCVVDDQVGAPTWCRDVADATARLIAQLRSGNLADLYHLTAAGVTTWCGFAREIFGGLGIRTPVRAILTNEYPTPAKRPMNSRLSCAAVATRYAVELPDWRDSLASCLRETS